MLITQFAVGSWRDKIIVIFSLEAYAWTPDSQELGRKPASPQVFFYQTHMNFNNFIYFLATAAVPNQFNRLIHNCLPNVSRVL